MKAPMRNTTAMRLTTAAFLFLILSTAGAAFAQDFKFDIPTIPYPPKIEDITNTGITPTTAALTVTAKIYGQKQQRPTCDKPDKDDCAMSDWYLADEQEVVPNPPEIKSVKVFYYKNDTAQSALSAAMSLAPELGENVWKVDAPLSALAPLAEGDTVTFYIVAIDSRGNVSSQVPETGVSSNTCPSSPAGWNAEYSTPATNSCASMTSYSQCNINQNGAASPCPTTFTMADKVGDTCGEPVGGSQSLVVLPKQDIQGITAAADATNFCVNMGLGAAPPDPTDAPPIEGYLLIIFNPDVFDDNPADLWIKNAYAFTFAPEIVGTDPSLVRVLWEADCLTDPGTANVLDCKLISITGTDSRLQIGYNNGLKIIAKKSGTGNVHKDTYSLIGQTSKMTYLIGVTGEINLSGGTAFWFSDLTSGMGFYHDNRVVPVGGCSAPPPPVITSTQCTSAAGTGSTGICPQTVPPATPTTDVCKGTFTSSYPTATGFKVYRSETNTFPTGATLMSLEPTATQFTDTHTVLDGKKYYYFVTTVDSSQSSASCRETDPQNAAKTSCTIEDGIPPAAPTITAAYTPAGKEGVCQLDFSIPALDSSLSRFRYYRDGVQVAEGAAAPATTSFTWSEADLTVGQTYSYTVQAVDRAGNTAMSPAESCTAQDRKSPARPAAPVVSNTSGQINAKIDWTASTESDLAGYNVYTCDFNNAMTDCRTAESFTKINASFETDTHAEKSYTEAGERCFYVEACDNCATSGTCPANGGTPNCSGFPPGGADNGTDVKCTLIWPPVDEWKPAFPTGVACEAPPQGSEIDLVWTKNCTSTNGSETKPFEDCNNPVADDLVGYTIQSGQKDNVSTPPDPAVGLVGQKINEFTHTNLINGTEYCYTVYAKDGNDNYSDPNIGRQEVCCTPMDRMPPATPTLTMNYTASTCEPAWSAPTEPNVTFTVLRCDGDGATCDTAAEFATSTDCVLDGNSCKDNGVAPEEKYTYCVVATDLAGNNTAVRAEGLVNCGVCTPGTPPPTNVNASLAFNQEDVNIYWTKSLADDGTAGGYNVYRCTDAGCASKTKLKSCTELPATSAAVQNISAAAPIILTDQVPSCDDRWYGVTFEAACGDGAETSLTAVSIDDVSDIPKDACPIATCTDPDHCVIISSCDDYEAKTNCSPLKKVNTAVIGTSGYEKVAVSGYEVKLMTQDGNFIGTATTTDADGDFKLSIDTLANPVSISSEYRIVLKIPSDKWAVIPADKIVSDETERRILLKESMVTEDSKVLKLAMPLLPDVGGAEAGNPNCDAYINMKDFNILKPAFGKSDGQTGYQIYADFNGDGVVSMKDFNILKANFNRELSAPPSSVEGLCKP